MDIINRDTLMYLQSEARLSISSLEKLTVLSPPEVIERVKKLEEQGVVKSYSAIVSNEKIGNVTVVFILFRITQCNNFVDYREKASQVVVDSVNKFELLKIKV